MSTRATIAHDNHFHLYREVFDEDCVYLELMNPTEAHIETRAGSGSVVVVAIPEDTWKKIVEGWLEVTQHNHGRNHAIEEQDNDE